MGESDGYVEHQEGGDRPDEMTEHRLDRADHGSKEPAGSPQQEQRRNDEGEDGVLHHVHAVHEAFGEIVNRPITGEPEKRHTGGKEPHLSPGGGRHIEGSASPEGQDVAADKGGDDHQHVWMKVPLPGGVPNASGVGEGHSGYVVLRASSGGSVGNEPSSP